MKRILPCLLMLSMCACTCLASIIADAEEAADGLLEVGEYDGSGFKMVDTESLIVAGGGADRIRAYDNAYIEVQYTSTPLSFSSGIYDIVLYDNSHLLYLDGVTEEITVRDDSSAILKGGTVTALTIYQRPGDLSNVTIYCQPGYAMNTDGISGLWANGTPFNIDFVDVGGDFPLTSECVTVIVPEPATLALLGLGGLLIRKRR